MPLLSRILPSDACKIFKQGLNIRRVLDLFVCEDKGGLTPAALQERHLMHSGGGKKKKSFQTPEAFFMRCIAQELGLKSPSAVYFSALANIDPHAARALITTPLATHPDWKSKSFLIFLFSLINSNNQ